MINSTGAGLRSVRPVRPFDGRGWCPRRPEWAGIWRQKGVQLMTAAPNVVVGGGIVGLATAHALQEREPDRPVLVLEKETTLASHQTGRNSGVIHSGLYYTPGSLKADLAVRGAEEMKRFCAEQDIEFDVPGKLVVATRPGEVPALERLLERGLRNGVPVRRASLDEVAEREPALRAVAAL